MSVARQILRIVSENTEPLWKYRRLNFGIDPITSAIPVHFVTQNTVEDVVIPQKLSLLENRQLLSGDDLGWRLLGERAGHDPDDITRAFNKLEPNLDNEERIRELSLDFVDWGELSKGFEQAFCHLTDSFISKERRGKEEDVATPRMAQLLRDVRRGHRIARVVPERSFAADGVKTSVIGARVEQGAASTPGELFGLVTPEEVIDQFWKGVRGPEFEPYDWRKIPSRIIVDVLVWSHECSRLRGKHELPWDDGKENGLDGVPCPDLRVTRNVLTFESNLPCKGREAERAEERTAWTWRLRNWNGVLCQRFEKRLHP